MGLRCEILSTGDEVLTGAVVDSNAAFLADALGSLGFEVVRHTTVGDDRISLRNALTELGAVADVVLCTGGLGPTVDDLTTEVVASMLSVPLKLDADAFAQMERRWKSRGQRMPENNRKQARVPQSAEILPNLIGAAPGYSVRIGRAQFFFLPGVPREMKQMFEGQAVPRLMRLRAGPEIFEMRVHRVFGLSESVADAMLMGLEERHRGVKLGFRAHFPELQVKLTVKGTDVDTARRLLSDASTEVTTRLGSSIFSDGSPMAHVVIDGLARAGATVTTAEGCTGGLVAQMLTSVVGASRVYQRGVVAHSMTAMVEDLGVKADLLDREGVVSVACAEAMAEGARVRGEATYALATTGILAAEDATSGLPVGTAIVAIASPERTRVQRLVSPGSPEQVQAMAAMAALDLLRRSLGGLPLDALGFGARSLTT